MIVHIPGYIQDGKLDSACGRIVIYGDAIMVGRNRVMDHNYLLRGLASKYRFKKDEVISNAIRLYFRQEKDRIVVCGVRKLDDDDLGRRWDVFINLIKKEIK